MTTHGIMKYKKYMLLIVWIFLSYRFDEKESVSGTQQLKSSVQKGIRAKLNTSFPSLQDHLEKILPKKDAFKIVKWYDIYCFLFAFLYSMVIMKIKF